MLERGVLDVRWPVDDDEEDQEVDGTVKDRRGAGGEQGYVEDRVREQSADGVWMMERLVQLDMIELHGEMPNSVDRGKGINPVEKRKMDRLAEEREEQRKEENGIPMSLQGAYAAFLGEEAKRGGWLTLEKYLVYAGLKRAGFIVLRADAWTGDHTVVNAPHSDVTKMQNKEASRTSLFAWIFNILLASKPVDPHTIVERQRLGPLVTPGLYRSYSTPAPFPPRSCPTNVLRRNLPGATHLSHSNAHHLPIPFTPHPSAFPPRTNTILHNDLQHPQTPPHPPQILPRRALLPHLRSFCALHRRPHSRPADLPPRRATRRQFEERGNVFEDKAWEQECGLGDCG